MKIPYSLTLILSLITLPLAAPAGQNRKQTLEMDPLEIQGDPNAEEQEEEAVAGDQENSKEITFEDEKRKTFRSHPKPKKKAIKIDTAEKSEIEAALEGATQGAVEIDLIPQRKGSDVGEAASIDADFKKESKDSKKTRRELDEFHRKQGNLRKNDVVLPEINEK